MCDTRKLEALDVTHNLLAELPGRWAAPNRVEIQPPSPQSGGGAPIDKEDWPRLDKMIRLKKDENLLIPGGY